MNRGTIIYVFALLAFLFVTSTATAYTVYNLSKVPVKASDSRYHFWNHYGSWDLEPGQHGSCPSKQKECTNAWVDVEVFEWQSWRLSTWDEIKHERCKVDVHVHEKVLVLDSAKGIECRVIQDPSDDEAIIIQHHAKEVSDGYDDYKREHLSTVHAWF